MSLVSSIAKLGLILLLVEPRKLLANRNLLNFSLVVNSQSTPQHPWWAVNGSVNTVPFLSCDSHKKMATPVGSLGEKVQNTTVWTNMPQTLVEVCQNLREFLLTSGLRTLQANLSCGLDAGASWAFSINGQTALIDTLNMNCTDTGPEARKFKEEWESNHKLRKSLQTTSRGDCIDWLRKILRSWEEMPEGAASQSEDSVTHQKPSAATSVVGNFPRIIILAIICTVLMVHLL
ncbi:retinoic acid early transcript 1E-like [Sorex fumeus]|uniref:retinoic acid early transcript 1E-like n=1 Tax=Sorex fumeus TaxID=62283 RepID=UPI0024AE4342|nr:retinoic acid early transcript 1E-like [Sorex fumeus]